VSARAPVQRDQLAGLLEQVHDALTDDRIFSPTFSVYGLTGWIAGLARGLARDLREGSAIDYALHRRELAAHLDRLAADAERRAGR
jgi:hypothetical protein